MSSKNMYKGTEKPFIYIEIDKNKNCTYTSSNFLGKAYIPKIPKSSSLPDSIGKKYGLFFQINFAEVKEIDQLDDFPDKGILQLYFKRNSSQGFPRYKKDKSAPYYIHYWPDVDKNNVDEKQSALYDYEIDGKNGIDIYENDIPPSRMKFSKVEYCYWNDTDTATGKFLFPDLVKNVNKKGIDYDNVLSGCYLGGYSRFWQNDFRKKGDHVNIVSMDDECISGFSGSGNLNILRSDLKNLKINKMSWDWDR